MGDLRQGWSAAGLTTVRALGAGSGVGSRSGTSVGVYTMRVQPNDNVTEGAWISQMKMSPYDAFSFLDGEWKSECFVDVLGDARDGSRKAEDGIDLGIDLLS